MFEISHKPFQIALPPIIKFPPFILLADNQLWVYLWKVMKCQSSILNPRRPKRTFPAIWGPQSLIFIHIVLLSYHLEYLVTMQVNKGNEQINNWEEKCTSWLADTAKKSWSKCGKHLETDKISCSLDCKDSSCLFEKCEKVLCADDIIVAYNLVPSFIENMWLQFV